jgi:hypothetical protein
MKNNVKQFLIPAIVFFLLVVVVSCYNRLAFIQRIN